MGLLDVKHDEESPLSGSDVMARPASLDLQKPKAESRIRSGLFIWLAGSMILTTIGLRHDVSAGSHGGAEAAGNAQVLKWDRKTAGERHGFVMAMGQATPAEAEDQSVRSVFVRAFFKARAEWRQDAVLWGLTTLMDADGFVRQMGHHVTAWFYSPSDCEARTIIVGPAGEHSQPAGFATNGYRIGVDFKDVREAIQKVRAQTRKAFSFAGGDLFVGQYRDGSIRPVWILRVQDPVTSAVSAVTVDANSLVVGI